MTTTKRLVVTAATMVVMVGSLAVPAMAQQQGADQYAPQGQVAQQQAPHGRAVSVTGVIERLPSDGGPAPYGVTDEASGIRYVLDRGEGGFAAYEGQRVTIKGTAQDLGAYENLDVADIRAAQGEGTTGPAQGEKGTATLSFEVKTDCAPPKGTTLLGYVPAEGLISAVLSDPDGDGTYTGSVDVPRFAPGPRPEGTEPVSVPVVIGQNVGDDSGTIATIKDFGEVKLDEDKAFSADASFCDDNDGTGGSTGGGTTGIGGGTTGGAAQYEDGGSAAVAGIDLNEDGVVSKADDAFAAQTGEQGVTSTPEKGALPGTGAGVLPSTGGALPIAGAGGLLIVAAGLLVRRISR